MTTAGITMRTLKPLLGAVLLSLLAAPGVAASSSALSGRLAGLPGKPPLPTVEVLNTRGAVVQSAPPKPSGAYQFFLSPGTYLVAGSAASAGATRARSFSAISKPVRVRPGKAATAQTHLKSIKPRPAAVSAGRFPIENSVVTVGNVPVLDDRATPSLLGANVGFHVTTLLFDLCSPEGTVFVDSSPRVVAMEKQERALSLAGKLTTPFDYRPLKPQFAISGVLSIFPEPQPQYPPNTEGASFELRATNLKSGAVVVETKFLVPQTTPDDPTTLQGIVDGGTEKFAGQACGRSTFF